MRILNRSTPLNEAANPLRLKSELIPLESPASLSQQLNASLRHVEERFTHLPEPYSDCMLFFSVAAPGFDAGFFFVRRPTLEAAWREGATRVRQWAWVRRLEALELRIDWPHDIVAIEGRSFHISAMESYPNSTWALADDDLENAELIPPIRLGRESHQPSGSAGVALVKSASIVAALAPSEPIYLLMQMRGIYTNSRGMQIALPRAQAPLFGKTASTASWLPYMATLKMLCSQQRLQGHWEEAADVSDHLGMTYALLIAQRHISVAESAHGMLRDAIRRAVSYVVKNMDAWVNSDDAYVMRAMCMLVLTRYLLHLSDSEERSNLALAVERLAETLNDLEGEITPQLREWVELARDASELFQKHAGNRCTALSLVEAVSDESCGSSVLLESFLTSLSTGQDFKQEGLGGASGSERWLAIAIAEGLSVKPYPDAMRSQCRRGAIHLQAFISSSRKQVVRPELALFLPAAIREKAAFVSTVQEEKALVLDGCTAARLLIRCFAVDQVFRAL